METIREMVQTLIIIVVLAVFLEMLLPQSSMRPYIKTVMGLLIIMALLQVATGVVREGVMADVPRFLDEGAARGEVPLAEVMAGGKVIGENSRALALENYRSGIQKQVLSMARIYPGILVREATVEVADQPDSPNSGQITRISLVVSPHHVTEDVVKEVRPAAVEPVRVVVGKPIPGNASDGTGSSDPPPDPEVKATAEQMALTLTQFYGLEPEMIELIYR